MTRREPDSEPALVRSTFWRDVASSVVSSLITGYVVFVVAGFVGIGALGGAGAPLEWSGAIAFLVLSPVLAGAGAHLAWTGYHLIRRQRPTHTRTLPWILACASSVTALAFTLNAVQGWTATLGLLILMFVLTGVTVWAAKKSQNEWSGWIIFVWFVINAIGSLIAVAGMGLVLGVILSRAVGALG